MVFVADFTYTVNTEIEYLNSHLFLNLFSDGTFFKVKNIGAP